MARSYDISKQVVWQAYQRVKANKGATLHQPASDLSLIHISEPTRLC